MRQMIAGNWKMNGLRAAASSIGEALRAAPAFPCDLLVCPPATLLAQMAALLDGTPVMLGAQDCHRVPFGAHTGDIAAPMLKDAGATWCIVGHSERRADHGDNDPVVRAKARAAAAAGLTPILCVGETEQHRNSGNAEFVVAAQLDASLPEDFAGIVAYEPVWAIGTGRSASDQDVVDMHGTIRSQLVATLGEPGRGLRILYGGSVRPGNAAGLLALPEVGGALVGGASLAAADFLAIARAVVA